MMRLFIFSLLSSVALLSTAQDKEPLFHDATIYSTIQWSAHEPAVVTPQMWIYLKDFYFEARYNYEDTRTFSIYAGKSFYPDKKEQIEITPLIGGVFGNLNGISPGLNFSASHKRFSTETQTQYTFDLKDPGNSFYWDWTNFSFGVYKNLGIGGSTQIYVPKTGEASALAGPMVNLTFKRFLFEAYSYNPWQEHPVWAFAIQYKFD
jgi:hypothetical protein